VEIEGGPLRLTLRHPAAPGALVREVAHADVFAEEAHHLLDRLIDLSVGAWDARRARKPAAPAERAQAAAGTGSRPRAMP
jgi:hypothetical protein